MYCEGDATSCYPTDNRVRIVPAEFAQFSVEGANAGEESLETRRVSSPGNWLRDTTAVRKHVKYIRVYFAAGKRAFVSRERYIRIFSVRTYIHTRTRDAHTFKNFQRLNSPKFIKSRRVCKKSTNPREVCYVSAQTISGSERHEIYGLVIPGRFVAHSARREYPPCDKISQELRDFPTTCFESFPRCGATSFLLLPATAYPALPRRPFPRQKERDW